MPSVLLFLVLIFFSLGSYAESEMIEFPDEELETETVLPYFPVRQAVRDRNVKLAGKIEAGVSVGSMLNEPIFNPIAFRIGGTYHLDEVQGINLSYYILSSGVSNNGKALQVGTRDTNKQYFTSRIPNPSGALVANYEFSAYYGKMSLTKQLVFNSIAYGNLGGGIVSIGESSNLLFNAGIGQKIFLTPGLALKFDLNFWAYRGPDFGKSKSIDLTTIGDGSVLKASDFEQKLNFNQALTVGILKVF